MYAFSVVLFLLPYKETTHFTRPTYLDREETRSMYLFIFMEMFSNNANVR